MKKGAASSQSTRSQAAAANSSSQGEPPGSRKEPSRPARSRPRGVGGVRLPKEMEIFSDDEARVYAARIRSMRRRELFFWLAFAAFTLLCTFALEMWGPPDGYALAGMLVALTVVAALLHSAVTDHRCPHCQFELTPSGRYARGTLDGDHCPRCQAPFNGPGSGG